LLPSSVAAKTKAVAISYDIEAVTGAPFG